MNNEIIVNASATETRVAILEKGQFVELYVERESVKSVVGSVIKGRVSRVLPGMQAAFVDIGLDKAGFLYVGDYFAEPDEPGAPESKSGKGDNGKGNGRGRRGRGRSGHRAPPPIESVLSEGQEIVVQVAKEPIGTKGARITSHVSIAGRHLVLTPWSPRVGVSRRIDSDRERKRLRQIVSDLRPKDLGFIIRTAGDGLTEADLEADIRYLTSVWDEIQFKKDEVAAPEVLYTEPNLPLRVVRDFASGDTKRIVIDDEATYGRMKEFIDRYMAAPGPRLDHYRGKQPIFDDFGLETQLHRNLERKVPLKSGGSLVIDQSEALTAIDVNSGRYVGKSDLEETVFKTNLEAVKEVVAQLRFRNIGGIIIIDLIDMESAGNRDKVYRALQEALRADKARTNLLKISELGLVEMTRKRTRESLVQTLCEPCAYCEGRGYVLSPESVALRILREVRKEVPRFCGRRLAIAVNPAVGHQLLGVRQAELDQLGEELGCELEVHARPGLHQEQFEVTALDSGPPVDLSLRWLQEAKPEEEEEDGVDFGEGPIAATAAGVVLENANPSGEAADGGEAPLAALDGALAGPAAAVGGAIEATPEASEAATDAAPDEAQPRDRAGESVDGSGESRIIPPSLDPVAASGEDAPEPTGTAAQSDESDESDESTGSLGSTPAGEAPEETS